MDEEPCENCGVECSRASLEMTDDGYDVCWLCAREIEEEQARLAEVASAEKYERECRRLENL